MKRTWSQRKSKQTPLGNENDLIGKKHDQSKQQTCSIGTSSLDKGTLSRKYFNDTVPEETVRSSLPSDLAEEYLSFLRECEMKRKRDDYGQKEIPDKKSTRAQQPKVGNKLTAEHKENLPATEDSQNSENDKKSKMKKGRRRKNTVRNLLKCLLCSEEFPTKQLKQEHYDDHLGPRGYECTFCAKAFEKMPALVSHFSRIHLIDKKLACKICGKIFRREWLLRSHSLIHTSGRKFSCPTCKMGFTNKRNLFEHISGHVGFNPYKCEECGKRFQKSSYLSLHRKIHVCVRPFKCKFCNIQCSSYSAMKIHVLMHSENLGFECADCNVTVPTALTSAHMTSHSRIKHFQCNLCPARFHAKSILRDHVKAHSGIKEYKCDVCEKVMQTIDACSEHVCLKWQECDDATFCPLCKLYIKKELWDGHIAKCHKKAKSGKSNISNILNEDDLVDESGECLSVAATKNAGGGSDSDTNEDDSSSDSSIGDYDSDEVDVDDVSEVEDSSQDSIVTDCISKGGSLDLDFGLVQKMRQIQNEVEEDESEDSESDDDSEVF